jgi:hypothetical protein
MTIDPNWLLVLTSSEFGTGSTDLGATLTDLYLKNLVAAETRPAKILFLNSAIFLTTEGSAVVEPLKTLEDGGTALVSCITCLTYHGRMEKVVVGARGDMKGTVADMVAHAKVVTV